MRDGAAIRARLGVVPQDDTLDVELTVRENLLVYGRYFGLPRAVIRERTAQLLDFVRRRACEQAERRSEPKEYLKTLGKVLSPDALTIGFNAQYIVDFLKAAGTSEVRLELKDAQSAGQLRPAEGDDYKYRYIVMPMRI